MSCCCCEEKPEQNGKAYRQGDQKVITKQPGGTKSSGDIQFSNLDQPSKRNYGFSDAAVNTEPKSKVGCNTELHQCRSLLDAAIKEKETLQRDNDTIQKENAKLQKENANYATKLDELKTEKKQIEEAKNRLQTELDGRSEKEKKRKELQKLYEDMKTKKDEVEQKLRQREASYSELMESHRYNERVIQTKDGQMAKLREEKKSLEMEKDELLVRLSALAGRKLTDNNPNIADLSDVNRPTKLAEKFSELYDNAWTDAFSDVQGLENFKDEKKTVTLLLELLKIAYSTALKAAEDQLVSLKKTLEIFSGSDDTLVNDVLKPLKDSRKKIILPTETLTKAYYDAIMKQESEAAKMLLEVTTLKIYVDECLQLCWLMAVQDPPLYFHTDGCRKGHKFDKSSFKEYTQGGDLVDFAVWPALYLQKDGSLLAKGVVQCKKMQDESEKLPNIPASESLNCLTDIMPKQNHEGRLETTTEQSLSVSRNGEEKNAVIDKTQPPKENFENNANKKRRNKEDNIEHPGSKASVQGFEELKNNEANAQTQAEKHKLAPEKKEAEGVEVKNFPISATSRSPTEYKKGNAENTVFVAETNNLKSESDSEIKTSNQVVTGNDSVVPDMRATSKPGDMRECKTDKKTVIVIGKEAADLKEDTTSRSEKRLSKTELKSPGKNDSNTVTTTGSLTANKAAFQSKTPETLDTTQIKRANSDNTCTSKSTEKVTVQWNSAPEAQAEQQRNEPKQSQEFKKELPQKVGSKNNTLAEVTSSKAKDNVSRLVEQFSKDSKSDDT